MQFDMFIIVTSNIMSYLTIHHNIHGNKLNSLKWLTQYTKRELLSLVLRCLEQADHSSGRAMN